MNLVPSSCAEVQALGQLRLELPATAHVLALRNQYLPLPSDWDQTAEALYSTFVDDLADRLSSRPAQRKQSSLIRSAFAR